MTNAKKQTKEVYDIKIHSTCKRDIKEIIKEILLSKSRNA